MRNTYSRQEPVKITYRDYKGFDQTKLSKDYKKSRSQNPINYISDANNEYDKQISLQQQVLDKHAHPSLKTRIIRENQALFMNKDLSKAIIKDLNVKRSTIKQEKGVIGMRSNSNATCASNSDGKL